MKIINKYNKNGIIDNITKQENLSDTIPTPYLGKEPLDNTIYLNSINWYMLDIKGFIVKPEIHLEKKAGIYIYQFLSDKNKTYIGSTNNIAKRITQHRCYANNNSKTCPKFYNYVRMHGWNNFRLGILEYINIFNLNLNNKCEIRKTILNREQYYLDKMNPSLNINKKAGSTLGYRHTQKMRKIMGLLRKSKSINWSIKDLSYTTSDVTKNNLSLRAINGMKVKVFDEYNNIINLFPTITSAAKYYDINHCTLSKYIKLGYCMNNLRFEAELKDVRVWIFDKQHNYVGVFTTANKAAEFCDTSHTVLSRYLKSGKLWKDKYYFSRTNYLT